MIKGQQQETLRYFRSSAVEWRRKAEGFPPLKVNVIKQRNDYVLKVARDKSPMRHALDVGCGSGELVCELARIGVNALGVDFASEMVELCQKKAEAEEVKGAGFITISIFDYRPSGLEFDLVSANGFIEYISESELLDFLKQARSFLAVDGSLVLGSRNRLFNAFSLNDYTQIEVSTGGLKALTTEAMLFTNSQTMEKVIEQLLSAEDSLPPIDRHPITGIEVNRRCQYTPGQLVRLLNATGFETKALFPIHYHGVVPYFARQHPRVHVDISDLMQQYAAEYHSLVPFASSFMLHASRK